MKTNIVVLFVTIMLVVGCSSPAYIEKDASVNLSDYKTYMWIDTRASENDETARATAFADLSVHNSVNAELQRWGWKEVSSDPDVLVSYDILVERDIDVKSEPVYSQSFRRYYYNPYTRRWGSIYYPSQFLGYQEYRVPVRDATLTISMMDADTDKTVWQGWTSERLNGSAITSLNIKKSVSNIFKEAGTTAP